MQLHILGPLRSAHGSALKIPGRVPFGMTLSSAGVAALCGTSRSRMTDNAPRMKSFLCACAQSIRPLRCRVVTPCGVSTYTVHPHPAKQSQSTPLSKHCASVSKRSSGSRSGRCAHVQQGQCGEATCAGRAGRGGLQRACRVDPAARASERAEDVRVAP